MIGCRAVRATLNSCQLCLLFTPEMCRAEPWKTLDDALQGGVDLVQWRVKTRDRAGAARALEICARRDVPLIVNDDVELAIELGAAGAHVGQGDMPADQARDVLGPTRWLGVSTHEATELAAALAASADYVGFGPMHPTATKGYTEGQPVDALARTIATSTVPVFAIGGITPDNAGTLVRSGARHLAVSGSILGSTEPEAAARALRQAIHIASPNEKNR